MRHRAQLVSPPAVCSQLIILGLAVALAPILTNNSVAQTCPPCAQMLAPGVGYLTEPGKLSWTTDNGSHWADVVSARTRQAGTGTLAFLSERVHRVGAARGGR